jgi:hypothetical protein
VIPALQSDEAPATETLSTGAAAALLNATPQSIRDWVRDGRLLGQKGANGRFRVDRASAELLRRERVPGSEPAHAAEVVATLADISTEVEHLRDRDELYERLLAQLEAERDRYRADSSTLRGAAIELLAAARETDAGVRALLGALDRQSEALVQLLGPGTPGDL